MMEDSRPHDDTANELRTVVTMDATNTIDFVVKLLSIEL